MRTTKNRWWNCAQTDINKRKITNWENRLKNRADLERSVEEEEKVRIGLQSHLRRKGRRRRRGKRGRRREKRERRKKKRKRRRKKNKKKTLGLSSRSHSYNLHSSQELTN
jgi:hypothetical protein